nr:MAG TPA: Large polyvalent protein associated domain 38 [Bacteriophage sp.]
MDFFQRVGNFFQGKGWVSDEEKRRKEQQTQPQNKPAVTFKQDPVLNNLNKTPSFGSPSPTQGLFQQKQEIPKTDTVPKVNTVPTANQFTKPVIPEIKPEIPQKTINDAPKVLTPQGQQDWVNKENKQIQNQNLANKPMITPKNPTYFDYLNPFGEHGLFGAKQQQTFKKTVEKPITDNINKFNNWIDSSDKEKGFQWEPGDILRFGAKLPGGIVQGLAETPNKVANAVTGIEADENGKVKQLNGVQRFGKALDAGLSVGGPGVGGSGTLIRGLIGLAKAGTKQAVKQGIGRTVLNGTKNLVKDSLKEGAEEVTQTFAQDLADDGKINTDKNTYFQSGTFGALGGGMMHGAGKLAQGVHNSYNNHVNNAIANHVAGYMVNPYATSRRSAAQTNLVNAINNKTDSPVDFGTLSKKKFNQVNELLSTNGQPVLESRNIKVYPAVVDKLIQKRVGLDGMTPQQVADVAYSAVHARNSRVIPSRYPHIAAFTKAQTDRAVPFATLAGYNGEVSLKSAYKKPLANSLADVERNVVSGESAQITPNEDARLAPNNRSTEVADRQLADNFTGATTDYSVANNSRNVNEDVKYKLNPEHEAQVRAYNEHITRLRQREEYLRGQGMSENAPAMINLRKAQEQAIYARDHIGEVDENGLKYKLSPEQEAETKQNTIKELFDKYTPEKLQLMSDDELVNLSLRQEYANILDSLGVSNSGKKARNSKSVGRIENLASEIYKSRHDGKSPYEVNAENNAKYIQDRQIRRKEIDEKYADGDYSQIDNDDTQALREKSDSLGRNAEWLLDQDNIYTDASAIKDELMTALRRQLGRKYGTNRHKSSFGSTYYSDGSGGEIRLADHEIPSTESREYYRSLYGDKYSQEIIVDNGLIIDGDLTSLDQYGLHIPENIREKITELRNRSEKASLLLKEKSNIDEALSRIGEENARSSETKYKIDTKIQEIADQEKLLARHLQLTGDENLVFNEWQNEMQKKALGYYDPKTDTINLNKLTEDTLNHELGHKLLTRVENKQDLLNSIRESYGDDYLINKYGNQYGNDLNLLAEEQLADGFSDYYNGRLNGEDKVRLGARLGIPQKVLAVYDRITEAIMGLVGKQDAIKQFYAQMETGKFKNEVFGNTEQLPVYKKSDSSADVDNYINELIKEQKLARKGEQPTLKERWQDFKADMREKFVDRFAPIEDKIKNQSEQLEMRNAIDRTLRADGISEAFIRDNKFDKLITSFKNKKELQTFDQALIAKHALELEANGIETGRDLVRDQALIKATSKRFAKEFKQVREYSDKVLQQTVDYGLISQDTANYLRKKYPDYIPFDRIFSDKEIDTQMKHGVGAGEASLSKQDIVQRIKGSSRSIDSPLNALITKTQDMIQQGERNKTAELLASYAKDPKNPFQLRELKAGESANGRPTISYLDNGKKRTFLAAPEVARAAKNMNREQMGIILRALATPARLLRMGATTVNAGFTMANVVKDFVGATINSKGGFNSMNPKTLAEAIGAGFHHKGDLYLEMQREGVLGNIYELTRNASELNLNEIRSHKNTLTRSIHNAKSPLKTLENTIGRSEDFGRALQYVANKKYAKRKGMSESEAIKFAADQARWNSTNFLRSGTYGKAINAIVPYSNANIQGQRITLRRMKENPARYTGKIALGIVAPTVAAMALSYSNDENKKIMENLPDYVKENNVVVIGPGAKYNKEQNKWEGVYLVPVPPQFSPLHRQLHNMVRSAMTGQQFDTGKAVGDAVEQVTTVNPMEIRRTGAQYVPQAVKPFVETWANKNLYTGQEVVPEGMKNLDGKDQWDNSTSLTARKVGELTGLSPKQIDNAFRTSTAGGGQNLLHGMDFAIAKATGASDDEIKGRSMLDSVVGRFYAPKGTSQSSYFYQSLEKAAKDNKLSGSDLELYQALTSRKYNGDGSVEGKTEGDVLMNNRILANKPNIVKALSEAAKWRSAQTGEELDPLYKLPVDKQQYFYHLQGSPKNGAEQRKLKQDAPWLEDFQKERSAYFKRQDFKSGKSNRVPYPEVSDELQATLKTYHDMPSSPQKWAFLNAHPELSDHYKQIEDYNNKVREAQGYAPLRTRPQQSQYVKMQMANKNWRDPAVAKYLQDLNVYNITNSASLAEMQGEELSPKALKAIQSVGKYGLVKNPDGTFALKYPDGQGTNESHIQAGAIDMSSFGRRRGGRSASSNGTRTSTDTLKLSNATALGMNTFKKNKSRLPQFSVKAIQKSGLLKSRRPTSRVVTFR